MKKVLFIIFLIPILILGIPLILCFMACKYNPPEGYTEEHHTYEEIVEFAKTTDPNAIVLEEYIDTTIEDWNRDFREYPAIINGIECHVSSVGDMVWNEGFLAGEFAKQYYIIDTDYDYFVLQQIVADKQPGWNIAEDDLGSRYNWNNVLSVYVSTNKTEQLSDEEIDIIWGQAYEIYSVYNNLPIRKSLYFCVPAPGEYYNHHGEGEYFIKVNSYEYIENFSEKDKRDFINSYHEAWALLESDLPIYD